MGVGSKVTIKDIARLSGVGISTVSRAVNNRPDVNEETRRRVMEVIEREGYVPNANAKQLKQTSSDYIGVMIRGLNNPFLSGIVELLQYYIERSDLHFILHFIDERDDEIMAAQRVYAEKKVQGVIFLGGSVAGHEDEMYKLDIPCVFSTHSAVGVKAPNIFSVSVDDRKAARSAVDYLFANGHRKIAVVGGERDSLNHIYCRYEGVRDSFREHGLEFDESLYFTSAFSAESAHACVSAALAAECEFTAIFAMSDLMAIGAAKAITDSGRRVPDDISIMGFDGLDMARFYNPTLTTMRQPREKIAEESVRLLMQGINGELTNAHITLDTELVEGNSVKRID